MSLWDAFYGRKLRDWTGFAIAIVFTTMLATLDLTSGRVNYPIGYVLPLIAIAPLRRRRRLLYVCALILCFLTFAIYFLGPFLRPLDHLQAKLDARCFDRTLAAIVVVGSAIALDRGARHGRNAIDFADVKQPWRPQFRSETFNTLITPQRLLILAFFLIALADFAVPAQFNLSILYLLAIVACACSPYRILLWALVLTTLFLTRMGYWLGPARPPTALYPYFLLNRLFVRVCAVAVAILTAPWIAWQKMDRYSSDAALETTYGNNLANLQNSPIENYPEPLPSPQTYGKAKRILYLDHTSAIGGGEIALLNLLRHLNQSHFVPVVALFADGPFGGLLREAGIETHLIPLPDSVVNTRKESLHGSGLFRAPDLFRILRHVIRLTQFIRAGRFDLVHTNSLKSDVIGGLAARIAGRKVLWHVRDRIDPDYLPRQAVVAFRTACCLLADYVVTNSQATLDLLRPTFGEVFGGRAVRERMRVVHDGVIHSAFMELRPGHDTFVAIGLVGRISPFKGQDVFIHAARIVLNSYPNCRFRIIGAALFNEEQYEREVRQLVRELGLEEAVEFTGFRNDITNAISELDILVHASVTGEPFGQVIVEGMAAGKPVVATNGGGVPEIVDDGITGLLVPMRDADALAHAVCRLLADRDAALAMGLRGQERVRQHFRIENSADKIERFYQYVFTKTRRYDITRFLFPRQTRAMNILTWIIWAGVIVELTYSALECATAFNW